jgi:hypothetical protein
MQDFNSSRPPHLRKRNASLGGKARAAKLTSERRRQIAQAGYRAMQAVLAERRQAAAAAAASSPPEEGKEGEESAA